MNTNNEEKDLLKKQTAATTDTAMASGSETKPYVESDAVKQAQSMLQQQVSNKQYTSPWQSQLTDTINKIMNREKFSYDLNGDALYQQYKDQYINQGRMAMMDTMGQAQAMTGGYGNSYAQSVGQQAYQGYMQQLTDKIPELYQLALSKYQMEGDALAKQYSVLGAQDDRDYGRFTDDRAYEYQVGRDKVSDEQWQKEFDEAIRQFNFKNKLGEFAPKKKSGGGGNYYTPKKEDDGVIDVEAEYREMKQAGAKGIELDKYLRQMIAEGNIDQRSATDLRDKRW